MIEDDPILAAIEARLAELDAAPGVEHTDEQRIKALAALLSRVQLGSGDMADQQRAETLAKLIARHRATAPDGPPASAPTLAAVVTPQPGERTSAPPAGRGEALPAGEPGVIPDGHDFVPAGRPPVVEPSPLAASGHRIAPAEEPAHQTKPPSGPAVIGEPQDPRVGELQRLWRHGLPSGVARVVEMQGGWPAVLAAMRPGETAREFKHRVEAGHAQADEAARRVASARGLDKVRARQAGRIA